MMKKYKVDIEPKAAREIIEISDYLKFHLKNKSAAEKQFNDFKAAINMLGFDAEVHPIFLVLKSGIQIRRVNVNGYLLLYFVISDKSKVSVIHAFHQSQSIDHRLYD